MNIVVVFRYKKVIALFKMFIIPLVLISLLFSSCKNTDKTKSTSDYKLIKHDSLLIYFPDTVPDISNSRNWAHNENYLSFLYKNDEITLYYFDFVEKKWNMICLSCFKQNRIQYSGAYVFLNDSIVLYGHSYKNELLIINLNKEIVTDKYFLSPDFSFPHIKSINFYSDSNTLLLPAWYLRRFNNSYNKDALLAMRINRSTKEVSYFGEFPSNINISTKSSHNLIVPTIVFHKKKLVMSFKTDKKLHSYSYKESNFNSILCDDKGIIEQGLAQRDADNMKNAILEEFNGLYKNLIYDKNNELYFRISVSYSNFDGNIPNATEAINEIISSREITISVLDSNLNILTKTKVEGVTESNCFAKNGVLYLRKKEEKENELNYIGYKLIMN